MALTGLALWLSQRYSSYTTPLSWTDSIYGYIVDDTLEKLNIDSESEVDASDLHKVGVFILLRQALRDTTFFLNKWSADGGSYDFGDLKSKIESELGIAFSEAGSVIGIGDLIIDWGENRNPYLYDPDRDSAGNF